MFSKIIYSIQKFIIDKASTIQIWKFPMFITFGNTKYKMKGEDIRDVLNVIQPGDILLRRYDSFLTGLMIPGYYTHAAIYLGNNYIIHMLGKGIDKQDILTFMRCDKVAVIHCKDKTKALKAMRTARALYLEKIEYDFAFDFSDETRKSCTELIDFVYDKPKMENKTFDYIVPDDLLTLDKSLFTVTYKK